MDTDAKERNTVCCVFLSLFYSISDIDCRFPSLSLDLMSVFVVFSEIWVS